MFKLKANAEMSRAVWHTFGYKHSPSAYALNALRAAYPFTFGQFLPIASSYVRRSYK